MTAKPPAPRIAVILAVFMAALCAFWPGASSAQGRDNPYAVAGVRVDETAPNSAAAQLQGFAAAQRLGFERLVRRITLPDDLTRLGPPQLDQAALERLVLSVDVEQERRSGTRYVGRLTVRYDPVGVRQVLRQGGYGVIDTRTAPVMVVPTAAANVAPETAAAWRMVWEEGGFGGELVPLPVAPAGLGGAPDWASARTAAESVAAGAAIYASLRTQAGAVSANVTEVGPQGPRDRGELVARINGEGPAATTAALADLAQQVSGRVQNEWKARAATGTGQRARISASALYSSQRQWQQIKDGLEGAASTLISEIRIEAVGREGALVSFQFVGDRGQLAAELQRRGVTLQDSNMGPVLRASGR